MLSTNLWHTNLNNVHYSVFFQICKARGIGYDEKVSVLIKKYLQSEKKNRLTAVPNFSSKKKASAVWLACWLLLSILSNCKASFSILISPQYYPYISPYIKVGLSNYHKKSQNIFYSITWKTGGVLLSILNIFYQIMTTYLFAVLTDFFRFFILSVILIWFAFLNASFCEIQIKLLELANPNQNFLSPTYT